VKTPKPMKLGHDFFARPAELVAEELIGKILVHRIRGRERRARIVETEAYLGPHDLAAHSSKGLTKRTQVLFGPPGRAYVYLIYGIHQMLNLVAHKEGGGAAVLIRAAEPLDGWEANLTGPGNLAKGMHITPAENGMDATGEKLFVIDDAQRPAVARTKRVGVDYAKHWKDEALRFYEPGNESVSRRPR
jgi:DNA-3-methyladenine glycosylase